MVNITLSNKIYMKGEKVKLQHPFRSIFYAPSFSGKTTLICNLLEEKELKKQFKKNIFVFCPTSFSDKSYQNIGVKEENIFEDYDPNIINEIMEESKQLIKKDKGKKKYPVLFIIDDAITDFDRGQSNILNKLFVKGRHFNCSIILTTQQAKLCTPTMRLNASNMFLFPQKHNEMEIKATSELVPIDKKDYLEMVDMCRKSEPYSYIYVDLPNPDVNQMFSLNGEKYFKIRDN